MSAGSQSLSRQELVANIRDVIEGKLGLPRYPDFGEDSRLNEELRLDSVLILQLFVHLEVDFGLEIPEEAITQKHLGTVGTLASFLLGLQR